MNNLSSITLAWELYEQGVSKTKIAQYLGKNRETIILWIQGIEECQVPRFSRTHSLTL